MVLTIELSEWVELKPQVDTLANFTSYIHLGNTLIAGSRNKIGQGTVLIIQ